jgi:hypothetical protein
MTIWAQAAIGAAFGLLGGGLFFLAMRRNAELYVTEGPGWPAVGLHVLRLAALAALLVGSVWLGGGAGLLGTFAGILAARAAALRAWRPRP